MEKYVSIRAQTALYISIFFISLHHVFAFLTNSSALKYIFNLTTSEVLSIYGIASLFGVCVYLVLFKNGFINNIKKGIYTASFVELICLLGMYYFTKTMNIYGFVGLFMVHHMITPYILFSLDALFESYTHVKDRGRGRGIYLTVWNIPFVIVPLMMSTLSVDKISITYLISSVLLVPFMFLIFTYIKNPIIENDPIEKAAKTNIMEMFKDFLSDKLDRRAFITQNCLQFYYGIMGVVLPIYLHSVFHFDWDRIGLIIAVMGTSFILIQIPFGNMEDRLHNEKLVFKMGLVTTVLATLAVLMVSPNLSADASFILLSIFLFLGYAGCSLIEISMDSMFYKHVTERDHTALLMLRSARIVPYALGVLAILFI